MHISGLKQSNFLTRADVGKGALLTIRRVHQENVAKQGAPEELRWCLTFDEAEKPMVLNSTNGQIISQIAGSEETDNWPNTKIVAYDDPTVSYGGKLVGGIRVRAPKNQQKPATATPKSVPAPAQLPPSLMAEPPDEDSEVPF